MTPTPQEANELRKQVLVEFKQVHKLAPADYTENCTNVVMSLVDSYVQALITKATEALLDKADREIDSTCTIIVSSREDVREHLNKIRGVSHG